MWKLELAADLITHGFVVVFFAGLAVVLARLGWDWFKPTPRGDGPTFTDGMVGCVFGVAAIFSAGAALLIANELFMLAGF